MDIRFYFFWVISRHGVARLCDMCMLNFWRNSETVFLGSWIIYILAALYESSNCSKTLLTLGITSHFYFSHSIRYVQFSRSLVSDSLQLHESQHARPPCPSATPGVHSDSRPSSQWCHPAISSSIVPFSSCPQSLPASESFPMSQLLFLFGTSLLFHVQF